VSTSDGPITGVSWSPQDEQFGDDPADYYRWLRDEQPVHHHTASQSWFLSRFDDVWRATADWRTFSSQSPVAQLRHMASMDPPDHDPLRASVSRWFSPRRIAALAPRIRARCLELLAPLEDEASFDLMERFATHFPSAVIHELVGIPHALGVPLREAALAIGAARDPAVLAHGMRELEALTWRVVRGEAVPELPGIVQQLLAEPASRRLPDEDIRGICSNLVLAGTDTVSNLIGNGTVLLSRHPAVRDRLARDPERLTGAIEEMLRFESPVQSLARRTTRDVTLHGVTIPAGAEVRLQWGAANRDEREFDRPDRFDPTRTLRRHLALGHGIHFCLGAGLARLEARIAFEEILARWPTLRVDEPQLTRLPSLWVRAWQRVMVHADRAA
jgi:cytochrome P450